MGQLKNFNGSTPAAPALSKNMTWQADPISTDITVVRNVSAYMPFATSTVAGLVPTPPNDATKYLDGTGNWTAPPSPGLDFTQKLKRLAYVYGYIGSGNLAGAGNLSAVDSHGDAVNVSGANALGVVGQAANGTSSSKTSYVPYQNTSVNVVGYVYGDNLWRRENNPALVGLLTLDANFATDYRFYFGFAQNFASSFATDTPTTHGAFFRFSTMAGDTNFQCMTSDNSTQTKVDSGVAADANSHTFAIVMNNAVPNVKFYIDGVLVATITTHLPSTTQNMARGLAVFGATHSRSIGISMHITQADL